MPVGLWRISNERPVQLQRSNVGLEKHLEEWIERDPGMLQARLTIVGRQIWVEGGKLDLLGLDGQGGWVVVEIKSGPVYRETIAQALDYASCIATMPYQELAEKANEYLKEHGYESNDPLKDLLEERQVENSIDEDAREVQILVVGTSRTHGLQRIVSYMADTYAMPIDVVTYEVFADSNEQQIMVRHLAETELGPKPPLPRITIELLREKAAKNGLEREFSLCIDVTEKYGLYPRLYQTSIMFAPPQDHRMCLFTIWTNPNREGLLKAWIGPVGFANYFPVTVEAASKALGPEGDRYMTKREVVEFTNALDDLFTNIYKGRQSPD